MSEPLPTAAAATPASPEPTEAAERYVHAGQWRLMWWKFRSHKLALGSTVMLLVLYVIVIFSQFLVAHDPHKRDSSLLYAPPQVLRFADGAGFQLRPFVCGWDHTMDMTSLKNVYAVDCSQKWPVQFFVHGFQYRMWGLWKTDVHLFGVEEGGYIHLLGTDNLGRDFLSRLIYGGQISLSIGLVGVALSFVLGLIIGGISGYAGGWVDNVVQRLIELLRSLPTIPLWMGLSAAVPTSWPSTRIYLMVTLILSLIGWTDLARVVRGKVLSVREEDFVLASRLGGAGQSWIIARHLLPSILSYTIVSLTLAIPGMILGETALSFLGLGLQPPALSWGVLLQDAQNVRTIALYPWLLAPAVMVIWAVLCFNFTGDGWRDAADPYVR